MKYKIMDHEPIYLAGVVHYGSLEKGSYMASDLEHDEAFRRSVDDLKDTAKSLKAQIVDEVQFNADHFSNDYREHRRQWKEDTAKASGPKKKDQQKKQVHEADGSTGGSAGGGLENAFRKFGDTMESFGRHMQNNAENWDEGINKWSQNFEKSMEDFGQRMESWGENFGEKMGAWGEDFGKRMEAWGESFGEQWEKDFDESDPVAEIRRYPIYRTYETLYKRYLENHPNHIKKQTFYEVQIMDTSLEGVTSMVMIGSRMTGLEDLRYPLATMVFEPDKWVAVKMSAQEYSRDWLGSLEKADQLKGYQLAPYFIIRHKKEGSKDEIRLFCPISERTDEG